MDISPFSIDLSTMKKTRNEKFTITCDLDLFK